MANVFGLSKVAAEASVEKGRSIEQGLTLVSRAIWPWHHALLFPLIALLAAMDLVSTYALLELSGKPDVYESGPLAAWALQRGGFNALYIMNVVAVGVLCLIAVAARWYYIRLGLKVFARTAYVVVLVPYALVAFAAIVNNFLLTFL